MVAIPTPSRSSPQKNQDFGDAAERLELLRLRCSEDPVARAIALFGSQILRRLDGLAKVAAIGGVA